MKARILDSQGNEINVVVADQEFLDANYPGQWEEIPGDPAPAPPPRRWITRLAFRNRFTQAELIAIEIASLDDASAPMAQRQLAAALRVMQRQVSEATYIDLDRADTRGGVQQLEALQLIGEGRALDVLDSPVQDHEVFRG